MALAVAVDSAYPFDFSQRPPDCQIIMGYVGRDGYTPHVWTLNEVQAARATGCQWWPIGVGISGGATNAQDGHALASVMIARLPGYGVSKTTPVFQDLEPSALRTDTAGAQACVGAWKADMHDAGYPYAYTYSLDAPFIDWIADWTDVRPVILPPGKIGVQYGGAQSPPAYDVSVFDPVLLTYAGGADMQVDSLTPDALNQIQQVLIKALADPYHSYFKDEFAASNKAVLTGVQAMLPDQASLERVIVDAIAVALAGGISVDMVERAVSNALAGATIPVVLSGHAGNPPVTP
jgi:hypothetical protein